MEVGNVKENVWPDKGEGRMNWKVSSMSYGYTKIEKQSLTSTQTYTYKFIYFHTLFSFLDIYNQQFNMYPLKTLTKNICTYYELFEISISCGMLNASLY